LEYKLKIKEYRILRKMTQKELAEKSECHQTYISQLEKNSPKAKSPTLKTIFKI
jgi:transcriptional regulator with XRE-family HTH domain